MDAAVIGWREFVEFPELCDVAIKAKIDSGARTSALHAFGLRVTERDGVAVASFQLHPVQRSSANAVSVSLPVHGYRRVRSSDGRVEDRPTVRSVARLGDTEWPIEVTLTSRDQMGFRMLLGRSAIRRRFLVDPGRSYLQSPRPRKGT